MFYPIYDGALVYGVVTVAGTVALGLVWKAERGGSGLTTTERWIEKQHVCARHAHFVAADGALVVATALGARDGAPKQQFHRGRWGTSRCN